MFMEGHAFAKRLTEDERRMVEDMTDNDVPPHNILLNLKIQNEHNVSTIDTIYEAREKYRSQMHAESMGKQGKFQNITEANCGCKLRRTCELVCFHEILVYYNTGRQIPLESIDTFWRRLEVENVVPVTRNDESAFDDEVDLLKKSYNK
uniref:SWIM-type domain-containing protein n=1 Tax=Lactuca sativa TaxID=4236 RepID=A0A9R1VXB3_LACSA|nr:hypothetical protein LSAT_V11C300128980 [Lactuca sativa]